MALSEAEQISLYEILEVPIPGSVDIPTDPYRLDGLTRNQSSAQWSLSVKINARIAALTAAQETRLKSYIGMWDDLGVNVTNLEGSIGDISGISDSPQRERMAIQARVKTIIPVIQYIDEIQMSADASPFRPLIR